MGDLSEHFSKSEFRCKCGMCEMPDIDSELILALEDLRELVQQTEGRELAIHISSGYRCRKHNVAVGGSLNSQHCLGKASDVFVTGLSARTLYKYALRVERLTQGGIGVYPDQGFLHLDTGPARSWAYLKGHRYGVDILSTIGS